MLSKAADTISGVVAHCLCRLHLICENIRKKNGVTQLMRHNRLSDCCVALHPTDIFRCVDCIYLLILHFTLVCSCTSKTYPDFLWK